MNRTPLTIGIVGATGMAGQTALDILGWWEGGSFFPSQIRAFASKSSAGRTLSAGNRHVTCQETELQGLLACDAVLFATESDVSKRWIPELTSRGILCVDKSSAWRMDPAVPLVVPEVNGHLLSPKSLSPHPLVANPNCTMTALVMALKPLQDAFGVKKVSLTSLQSVSGTGKAAMDVLREESLSFFNSDDLGVKPSATYPKTIAFNALPLCGKPSLDGWTDEEEKVVAETRKVLGCPDLVVSATCTRVPVFVGHSLSVTVELGREASQQEVLAAIRAQKGLQWVPETGGEGSEAGISGWPTPREAQGQDEVFLSRLRPSPLFSNGWSFWTVMDNLRKGAALNAIQIIDTCAQNGVFEALKSHRKKAHETGANP